MAREDKNPKAENKDGMIKISLVSVLIVMLFIVEIYEIINDPKNYMVLGVLGVFILAAVYTETVLIHGMMLEKAKEQEEAYNNVYRSEKASYLLMRKYFDEIEKKIEILTRNSGAPYKELVNAQKALAKVQINRSKENTYALMNSNEQMLEKMLDFQKTLESNTSDINENQKDALKEHSKDLIEKQQEILAGLRELESSIKNEMLGFSDKISSIKIQTVIPEMPAAQQPAPGMGAASAVQPERAATVPSPELDLGSLPADLDGNSASPESSSEENLDQLLKNLNQDNAGPLPESMPVGEPSMSLDQPLPESMSLDEPSMPLDQPLPESMSLDEPSMPLDQVMPESMSLDQSMPEEMSLDQPSMSLDQPLPESMSLDEPNMSLDQSIPEGMSLDQPSMSLDQPSMSLDESSMSLDQSMPEGMSLDQSSMSLDQVMPEGMSLDQPLPDMSLEEPAIEELKFDEPELDDPIISELSLDEPPLPESEPLPDISADANHVMTPDEIAALVAGSGIMNETPMEIQPEPEPELAALDSETMEPEPEPISKQETPEAILASLDTPASDTELSGQNSASVLDMSDPSHVMSPDEIAALIANTSDLLKEPEPVKEEKPAMPDLSDPSHVMSPDEIAALIANM